MGGTTAIVLVALIIALMLVLVIALLVWGAVRALEVRHASRSRSGGITPAITTTPSASAPASHPMFDREQR